MKKDIAKNYSPGEVEGKIYERWLNNGYFTPVIDRCFLYYTL